MYSTFRSTNHFSLNLRLGDGSKWNTKFEVCTGYGFLLTSLHWFFKTRVPVEYWIGWLLHQYLKSSSVYYHEYGHSLPMISCNLLTILLLYQNPNDSHLQKNQGHNKKNRFQVVLLHQHHSWPFSRLMYESWIYFSVLPFMVLLSTGNSFWFDTSNITPCRGKSR